MRSLPHIFTRFGTAVVILALSILSACNDRNLVAPLGGDPGVGPLTTVDVLYCAGPGAPAWVAFQDGEGAWTTATPILDGRHAVYRHSFAANHGGIAAGQRFSGLTTLNVIYGAPAELAAFGNTFPGDCDSSAPKAILGTIAGLADNQVATVTGGFSSAFIFPGDHSFVLTDLSNEPQTILATRTTRVNDVLTLDKLILRRTPVLPDSATIPVLDFNSDEAFAPAVANVTIEGLAPEGARTTLTRFITTNSQSIISFLSNSTTAATRSFNALPASRLGPNDLQALTVSGNTTDELTIRTATNYFRAPVDQTIALGPAAVMPAISVISGAPALRLRAVIAPQTVYDKFTSIVYQQNSTIVGVGMTAQYASLTNRGYDLTIPDFSALPGFDPQLALRANATGGVFWTESRVGGTQPFGANIRPIDGAFTVAASRNATFTP
jgi:hypothetical protein